MAATVEFRTRKGGLAIPPPKGGRRSLGRRGGVPGAVPRGRVLLLGVLAAVLHRLLEIADALTDPLAELGELPHSEEQDDDGEDDEEFRNSEVGQEGPPEGRNDTPSAGEEREERPVGAVGARPEADRADRGVPVGAIDLAAEREHLLERAEDLPGPLEEDRLRIGVAVGLGEGSRALEAEGHGVVVGRAETEVLEIDDGEGAVGGAHQVVGVEVAVGRDGIAGEGRIRRVAGEPAGELFPEGGAVGRERRAAVPLESPAAGVGQLGTEEGRVEGRVEARGAAGDPAKGHEELLGLVEEALALLGAGLADLVGEVVVSEVLDEGGARRGLVVEEGRDPDPGLGEGLPDHSPAFLSRGGGSRVEDEDDRSSSLRREAEIAPLAYVPRERNGRSGRRETETGARGREPRALLGGGRGRHALSGVCSTSSTFRIFW